MDFAFSPDDEELRSTIQAFIAQHLTTELIPELQEPNTGEAHIYGVEWDLKGTPLRGLTLSTSGSVNRAMLVSTGLVLNEATGKPYRDVPVEGVPLWNAKIAADYVHSLWNDVTGFGRIDTKSASHRRQGTYR